MKRTKEENESMSRETFGDLAEHSEHKFALIYDPSYFSIDFVREWKDKIRWIFNNGPYDEKLRKEFNMDDDPYGFGK